MNRFISTGSILVGGIILGYSLNTFEKGVSFIKVKSTGLNKKNLPITLPNLPSNVDKKVYQNYIVSYNRRTKSPDWVLERLTPKLLEKPKTKLKKRKFKIDKTEDSIFQVHPEDYDDKKYNRGHMAAAANYTNDEIDRKQTYVMTNVCPQFSHFNQGIWSYLEEHTREKVNKSDYVFVCTGPLYLPKSEGAKKFVEYDVMGAKYVAVPTHFFKVLLVKEKGNDCFKLFSYVLPHEANNDAKNYNAKNNDNKNNVNKNIDNKNIYNKNKDNKNIDNKNIDNKNNDNKNKDNKNKDNKNNDNKNIDNKNNDNKNIDNKNIDNKNIDNKNNDNKNNDNKNNDNKNNDNKNIDNKKNDNKNIDNKNNDNKNIYNKNNDNKNIYNKNNDNKNKDNKNIQIFYMDLKGIERQAGFIIFSHLIDGLNISEINDVKTIHG